MGAAFTEERAEWLYRHYRWLEEHLPKRDSATSHGVLVLPTKDFLPSRYAADHVSAEAMFLRVRDLMGMTGWHCKLEPKVPIEKEMQADFSRSGMLGEFSTNDAAGTFSIPEEEVLITYSPALLKEPISLVATLAHELCHYLLATVRQEPPATWKELEPLTDLAAVAEGFGIFLCKSAFQFKQWTEQRHQGWSVQRQGYLSEAELGFATAIFCVRNRVEPKPVAEFLKPNPREVFCDAIDYLLDLEDAENPE